MRCHSSVVTWISIGWNVFRWNYPKPQNCQSTSSCWMTLLQVFTFECLFIDYFTSIPTVSSYSSHLNDGNNFSVTGFNHRAVYKQCIQNFSVLSWTIEIDKHFGLTSFQFIDGHSKLNSLANVNTNDIDYAIINWIGYKSYSEG